MSTTFAVKIEHTGMEVEVAKRSSGEIWFTHGLADLLSDETPVIPTDNTAQGIYTIGDIRNEINRKVRTEEMNRLIATINESEEDETSWIKDPSKIEFRQRKSAFVPLNDAWHVEHDFLEVTEWTNGEGWDIVISDDKHFSLHFTEFAVLKELIARLENQ
jgi:hypothetical protein